MKELLDQQTGSAKKLDLPFLWKYRRPLTIASIQDQIASSLVNALLQLIIM